MSDTVEQLQLDTIKKLQNELALYKQKIELYENGDLSLYYAVKRKMSEFAIILNKNSMEGIDMDDKNSKTFERITAILEKCEKIAASASALGVRSGIEKAIQKEETKPFVETIADSR